jgi:hypothetical protein
MPMEAIPFAPSGNIQDIQYDADTQTLIVQFHYKNRKCKYSGVTGEEATGFANSISANDYLQRFIIPQHAGEPVADID